MDKIRKRLTDIEAEHLGLDIKQKPINGNPKYIITEEQLIIVNELRGEGIEIKTTSKPNNYKKESFVLSAWSNDGYMMNIDQYCETYTLPRKDITSYKLVSHTGTPFYNIVFKENLNDLEDFDYLGELEKQLQNVEISLKRKSSKNKEGVITLTDLHFGAYISALKNTPEFNISILCNMLEFASKKVNEREYKKVHLHLLGDLIESFTGLNHKNSWKGLEKGMFGVSAIKLFVELFIKHFLNNIVNLGSIKIVAGNHDRVTSDNNEDTDGGVAELISWGLSLTGYDVEFSTDIITHNIGGVSYILNHGHHYYTKKLSTQEMCWKYGEKGKFNFITEGHLHSRIQKLNAVQLKGFKMISDDNVDCRRQVCPSLFTGNSYSEYGGWSTMAGFIISEEKDSGKGVDVFDISI